MIFLSILGFNGNNFHKTLTEIDQVHLSKFPEKKSVRRLEKISSKRGKSPENHRINQLNE